MAQENFQQGKSARNAKVQGYRGATVIDLTAYRHSILDRIDAGITDQQFTWLMTDVIYMHLFGMDANGLRVYFGLPDSAHDDTIRDCMSPESLLALGCIELKCLGALQGLRGLSKMRVVLTHSVRA